MKKIFVSLFVLLLLLEVSYAQVHKFQAAYLYNICKHMDWPAEYKKGNFIIGVLTNNPIVGELKKIASSKKYINQKIEVKVFKNVGAITKCHVLFVPTKQTSQTKTVLSKIGKNSTLLFTSKKGAISLGSGVNFILVSSKLKFEIKKSNIIKKRIKVSSGIEKLAVKRY